MDYLSVDGCIVLDDVTIRPVSTPATNVPRHLQNPLYDGNVRHRHHDASTVTSHLNHDHHPPQIMHRRPTASSMNHYPQMTPSEFSLVHHPYRSHTALMRGPPTGHGMSQPHNVRVGAAPRHQTLPYFRAMPFEETAMLETSEYHQDQNFVNFHRDRHRDTEQMSFEELLELGDRMGNANIGLTSEAITRHMKTRVHISADCTESQLCVICQCEHENEERIGTLDCGHEYHAECLHKWLLEKNVCPMCKSTALPS